MNALSLRGIRKRFGGTVALDGVDLDVAEGEVLAVVGENGAGKSTLLNVIAGALEPDGGEVRPVPRSVAYIRQELSLFPHLTVAENILMGREPSRFGVIDGEAMAARARALLDEFGRPEIAADDIVGRLAPASRQVVEICRALAADARIILMDEPTSSLERADVVRLFASIRKLCARGIAVLYVSHFLEEIREIAARAVVLRDGRSVWAGTLAGVTDEGLIRHMIGRPVEAAFGDSAPEAPGEVVLSVVSIGGASFEVRRGEILGIAGLVGSGRTEMLRAVFGLDAVPGGELKIRDERVDARRLSPVASIRRGIGYLSEDRRIEGLFPHLSVRENLAMTRPEALDVGGWIERLRIKAGDVDDPVVTLSGGNQQKVLLARLLHQGASILLLDEPTRGIDVGTKAEIYELIRALAREGRAILMVSSYLPELFGVCDHLAVMNRGALSAVRPIDEWTPDSVLEAAIGGGSAAA
ncbi:MAG: sugar ABC transporter ATP-binding protein [Vicinamibacteria bacterium]|nr:sugar ABC transporter ATP-binding protein [Vicinamibacteria bacterium]